MFSAATKTGSQPSVAANYIEDVFSTYLYTGNDPTGQTINNGIDLSTKGGLVWLKSRSAATNHNLFDTVRGVNNRIFSNLSNAQATLANSVTSFNTTGFTLGSAASGVNTNADTYCSWTFAEQPKFFDVVTYSGDSVQGRTISHNLGSVPGMMIVKRTNTSGNWTVYHRSIGATNFLELNLTNGTTTGRSDVFPIDPTSTVFSLGNDGDVNASGSTYIAYLFAHDAGGFGTSGTDNVISCGSYTGTGSALNVSLGYEPQWVMIKRATGGTGEWTMFDIMRGMTVSGSDAWLYANTSGAEIVSSDQINPTATGMTITSTGTRLNASGDTYIYMAIRRPMKVPTDATTVFSPVIRTGNATSNTTVTAGFPVDMFWNGIRDFAGEYPAYFDRLRGNDLILFSNATNAEFSTASVEVAFNRSNANTGVQIGTNNNGINGSGYGYVDHFFRRASGFFDEVCYTGTGSATTQAHNLGVVPELIIVKCRNSASPEWVIYNQTLGNGKYLFFDNTSVGTYNMWNATSPTNSVFSLSGYSYVNGSGNTYVAYLFATCAGVSKVGSYTGNGTTQAIACGFTGGARFVLIKRTDSTGDWYVYDTARGMTLLTDPYLRLNSTAAESATLGSVTTTTGGFTVDATILAAVNTNAASYIFLAIA